MVASKGAKMSQFRYDWGETVRVVLSAPLELRPGALAAVCGMRVNMSLDQHAAAQSTAIERSAILYLIEYCDGYAVEVPEEFLEAVDKR